jgi:hypothetical protein
MSSNLLLLLSAYQDGLACYAIMHATISLRKKWVPLHDFLVFLAIDYDKLV